MSGGDTLDATTQSVPQRLRSAVSNALYMGFWLLAGVVLLGLLSLLKAQTIYHFKQDAWLLVYAIFVTMFELSRLAGAALYRNSINKIMHYADIRATRDGRYEPLVTFVIPAWNEGMAIKNTIEKCYEAEYPADKLEVIVVNDGSTDDTGKALRQLSLRFPQLVVVSWRKNRGKRQGMAEGFRRAKGEIIIQLDSDSYIKPDTVYNLIKPFAEPNIGAVCAHADPSNASKNIITKMQAAYYYMSFRILKSAESVFMSVFCCSGCSSAYRKDVVLPIMDQWLGERFLGQPVTWGDDRALTSWVIKRGYKSIYTDLAQAYTICPETMRQFFKQQARWKKSWIINAIITGRFIWRKRPVVALTYFFPLILVSVAAPFVALRALVYDPIFNHYTPFYYIVGVLLFASIITVFYRVTSRTNKYWPYLFAWAGISTLMSLVILYAAATIQNRGWGTR
jgi:hyaluronan synthase